MAKKPKPSKKFNIVIVGQNGRLQYEAALFAASLRKCSPDFKGRLIVAEPQPGPNWDTDPRMANAELRELLLDFGAEIVPFESKHFGENYPHGNKIEALAAMPKGEPFVFFDTDTLITGDLSKVKFNFNKPSASMRRTNTWPEIELYGPGYNASWKSLYDRFGLDFASSLDLSQPDEYWERYLYFNAGWFYHRCPHEFGARFAEYAVEIRDNTPDALVCQSLDPWLDQVALPLVIHSFGGGRPGPELDGLDGDISCHWRVLALLYAREPDHVVDVLETVASPNKIKKVIKQYDPIKRMIFQRRGQKVRAMFDRDNLPNKEQKIRNQIKREGFWMR